MGQADKHGAAWFYELPNDLCGCVSCESNSGDIKIPTVTIGISLGDASELTKSDLLNLLDTNGNFFRATLTAQEIGGTWTLFLQYKVMAESFKPDEFLECIGHLTSQAEMFMTNHRAQAD